MLPPSLLLNAATPLRMWGDFSAALSTEKARCLLAVHTGCSHDSSEGGTAAVGSQDTQESAALIGFTQGFKLSSMQHQQRSQKYAHTTLDLHGSKWRWWWAIMLLLPNH